MSARRDFLLSVFRQLDAENVEYCVLRNYGEMFGDEEADVDLLTRPRDVPALFRCCARAADAGGWKLVQKTRFVNHSLVFWDGGEAFVRIDVDTDVRWRFFHVLDAGKVLRARIRREEFYIPSPEHEGVVLLTQALWQGRLKDRYARQLDALGVPAKVAQFRQKVLVGAIRHPVKMIGYAVSDVRRLASRFASQCGISLRLVTARGTVLEEVTSKLAVLFPPAKTTAFKGGIAPDVRQVDTDVDLADECSNVARGRRSFLCVEDSSGNAYMIHVGSGFMKSGAVADLGSFIPEILSRQCSAKSKVRRGLFVVLVGLDGSGKTTFARNLCGLLAGSDRFQGARYFHWIPGMFGAPEYPLPAFEEVKRKSAVGAGLVTATVSLVRLLRNLMKAHLSYWFRVRPLRRRGEIIIVDRFVYNYWLDPVSVKYAGPPGWVPPMLKLFPHPDVVITLSADSETLLSRKRELSREEIANQIRNLKSLPSLSRNRMELDASKPADHVARLAFEKLEQITT